MNLIKKSMIDDMTALTEYKWLRLEKALVMKMQKLPRNHIMEDVAAVCHGVAMC
jgi:hypothetical protein